MKILKTVSEISKTVFEIKNSGKTIGFVPTMGALHAGHLQLVKQSVSDNDFTIVSIFVNPLQFNNTDDLKKYPRNIDKDAELLKDVGCDFIFAPTVEEMYPTEEVKDFNFYGLDEDMEGKFRPGHFKGVAVVVDKLFLMVKPNRAYFGKKDFQQLAIIKKLVEIENHDLEIIECSIVREEDGLAMSSRNVRLLPEHRKVASEIFKMLNYAKENYKNYNPRELEEFVFSKLNLIEFFKPEYVKIVENKNLKQFNTWNDVEHAVICVAVHVGEVRLIDNVELF